jgi:sulfur carrier protein
MGEVKDLRPMQVTVNGAQQELAEGMTVADLLVTLALTQRRVAVEINRELVPRSLHPQRKINPGDAVEIVGLVGGG